MMNDIRKFDRKLPTPAPIKVLEKRVFVLPRLLLGLLLVSVLANVYFIFWGGNNKIVEEASNRKLVEEVGEFIALPDNEIPTIATVSDPAKLTDQRFFAKAQTGDKVLIYTKNNKAILYRPAEKRLIEVVELNLNLDQ